MGAAVNEQETVSVCPVPECEGGMVERRSETPTRINVHWTACAFCDGNGTVSIAKAAQWRASHPSRRKISGVMRRGGF